MKLYIFLHTKFFEDTYNTNNDNDDSKFDIFP